MTERDLSDAIKEEIIKEQLPTTVELYDIFLDSQTLHFTDHTEKVTFFDIEGNSQEYIPISISREPSRRTTDNRIDVVIVTIDNVNSFMSSYIASNEFRGRRMTIRKVFLDHLDSIEHQIWIVPIGIMDSPDMGENSCQITVKQLLDTLNVIIPRRRQGPKCDYKFGNEWCIVNRESAENKKTGTIDANSTQILIKDSERTEADNHWQYGELHITGGTPANIGERRAIRKSLTGEIYLDYSLPAIPVAGDTYEIFRGCAKILKECVEKFLNEINFGGFHTVPLELLNR